MTPARSKPVLGPAIPPDDEELALMARNGITRVPADQYHVDGYRYTNLADALAQVRRSTGSRAGS